MNFNRDRAGRFTRMNITMSDAHLVTLARASSRSHSFELLFSEKPGWTPQFKLKLSQTFTRELGPELLRTITLPMQPATVIARAILAADAEYQAAGGDHAPDRIIAGRAARAAIRAAEVLS